MPDLRLGTFNVPFGNRENGPGSWRERRPLLRRAYAAARADVLGLQEVLPSRLSDVAEDLDGLAMLRGPVTGPPRWIDASLAVESVLRVVRAGRLPLARGAWHVRSERQVAGQHQPIAYRADRLAPRTSGAFWISATPGTPGSMLALAPTPFLVHWAWFERRERGARLLVCNAHFGHAPWHRRATARIALAEITRVAAADGGLPAPEAREPAVVLLGDLNAGPDTSLLRALTSGTPPRFADAARLAPERRGPPATYHWGVGTTRMGLTLDHVLARGPLVARLAEVVDVHDGRRYPSDHHPLVVEFADAPARYPSPSTA